MKTTLLKPAHVGSISHGTLRTEDLLSTFASELESLILVNGDYFAQPENRIARDHLNNLVGEAQDMICDEGELRVDVDPCDASELINDMQDMLQTFAPPYCYFGAHEGDGSDFGFWPSHDSIEELPTVDGSDAAIALGEDCKSINDHGNVTVYSGTGEVLLELV